MNVLDLFSGIGGFSLGLERAGFTTVAFCEIDPYCRRVLRKHWPDVPVYDDVRTLTAARLVADNPVNGRGPGRPGRSHSGGKGQSKQPLQIDVICGGFPCQDISTAGKGAGITGSRSGLWKEYARIIGEVRPRYVIVENVAALLHRGLADVLGDLAALGYDAEWHCIRASDVGAPHRRDRVWIIAYPQHPDADSERPHRAPQHVDGDIELRHQQVGVAGSVREDVADADSGRCEGIGLAQHTDQQCTFGYQSDGLREAGRRNGAAVADADRPRLEGWLRAGLQQRAAERAAWAGGSHVPDADGSWETPGRADGGMGGPRQSVSHTGGNDAGWWLTEPGVGRVAHGVPSRVDRLRALGNAVVPQIPEIIGRAIMKAAQ